MRKRKIAFMMATILVIGGMPQMLPFSGSVLAKNSIEEIADEKDFVFDAATGTITAYIGQEGGNLSIPQTINGVQVKVIGQQAFDAYKQPNVYFKRVVFPEGLEKIEAAAFYAMAGHLEEVYIPSSVTEIAPKQSGFFPFPGGTIIYGEKDSYAEQWAEENGFTFKTEQMDLTANLYFKNTGIKTQNSGNDQLEVALDTPVKLELYTPEGAEIEWNIENKQLNASDTTEYVTLQSVADDGKSCVVRGNAVMQTTPYHSSKVGATVTATVKGSNKKVSLDLVVSASGKVSGADIRNQEGKSIAYETLVMVEGETLNITGVSCPDGTNEKITYSSDDTAVATVGQYGTITAKGEGETLIIAQTESKYQSYCYVQVLKLKEYKDYIKYVALKDGTITIRSCTTDIAGGFEVPQYIEGRPVTELYDYSFCQCENLESITIPSTVRKISDKAFYASGWGGNELMDIIIVGEPGSYAEQYASQMGLTFQDVNTYTAATTAPKITATPVVTTEPSQVPENTPLESAGVPTVQPSVTPLVLPTPVRTEPVVTTPVPTVQPAKTESVVPTKTPLEKASATVAPTKEPVTAATTEPAVTQSPALEPASLQWKQKTKKIKKGKKFRFVLVKKNTTETISWSVSNTKKATISAKGVLYAKKPGKIKITAKCGTLKKVITVTIKK